MKMNDFIKTPRGNFQIKFETQESAKAAGFFLWFEHKDTYGDDECPRYALVSNGTEAYGVLTPTNQGIIDALARHKAKKQNGYGESPATI